MREAEWGECCKGFSVDGGSKIRLVSGTGLYCLLYSVFITCFFYPFLWEILSLQSCGFKSQFNNSIFYFNIGICFSNTHLIM